MLSKIENKTNKNSIYLLKTNQKKYIIKKFYKNTQPLEQKLHRLKLCPKLYCYSKECNIAIFEQIKGNHKTRLKSIDLKNLAKSLKRLHVVKVKTKRENLRKILPKNFRLKNFKPQITLCHNDLIPTNVLFGQKVNLIDFEFSSLNDKYFDFASLLIEFKLTKKAQKLFFLHYGIKPNKKKLSYFMKVYKEVCINWGLNC